MPPRGRMEAIDEGPVFTHHEVTASLKVSKPGTLHALAYCNIHGLWESSKEVSWGSGVCTVTYPHWLVLVWKPCSGKAPGCFGIRLQGRKPLRSRFCPVLGQ